MDGHRAKDAFGIASVFANSILPTVIRLYLCRLVFDD